MKYLQFACLALLCLLKCTGAELTPNDNNFLRAAGAGKMKAMQRMLAAGVDVNVKDELRGRTGLHMASKAGKSDVVKELLAKGADLNAKDNKGRTALHLASKYGKFDVMRELIDAGADLHAKDSDVLTALQLAKEKVKGILENAISNANEFVGAAANGQADTVQQMLTDQVVNVNVKDESGQTALHNASKRGHLDVMKVLIGAGAEKDATENLFGRTALHVASYTGKSNAVEQLINEGANMEAKDLFGATALHLASEERQSDVVTKLIKNGAKVNAKDNYGYTALQKASACGCLNVVEELLAAKGVKVNAKNKEGETALHKASEGGYLEVVKELLAKGANPFAENKKEQGASQVAKEHEVWKTLLDNANFLYAAQGEQWDTMNEILGKGLVIVDVTDKDGRTALHWASLHGRSDIVKMLLDNGALPDIQDKRDATALQLTEDSDVLEILQNAIEEHKAEAEAEAKAKAEAEAEF